MADGTAIAWTDATWNIAVGCRNCSEGCRHCFARKLTATRLRHTPKYRGLAVMRDGESHWTGEARIWRRALPLVVRWRRPRRIFTTSEGDLFYEGIPDCDVDLVYAFMALGRQHQHQNLTKRPARRRAYLAPEAGAEERVRGIVQRIAGDVCWQCAIGEATTGCTPTPRVQRAAKAALATWRWPLPQVIEMTSVEDQASADERVPELLTTRCMLRGISYEPALAGVDFTRLRCFKSPPYPSPLGGDPYLDALRGEGRHPSPLTGVLIETTSARLDWIIWGGESGAKARPNDLAWGRRVRDQCRAVGVAFFAKQLGARVYETLGGRVPALEIDAPDHVFTHRAGADPSEWPRDLRVQEFPPWEAAA